MNLLLNSSARATAFMAIAFPMLAMAQPPNDICTGAVIEPLAAGATVTRTGDSSGATDDLGAGGEVWEAFTTTQCLDVTIDLCGTNPVFSECIPYLIIGCPITNLVSNSSSNFVDCGDLNWTLQFFNLPAGTYYFPVAGIAGSSAGPYTVHFTGNACTTLPPANDDCIGATALVPDVVCVPVVSEVAGATQSLPGTLCNGFTGDANDDVWFSFVAASAEQTIVVEPSSSYNAVIDLYEGDCQNLIALACANDNLAGTGESIEATGLTVGNTYYFRVYDWSSGQAPTTQVSVCVITPGSAPPNDFCADVLPENLLVGTPLSFSGTTVGATELLDAASNSTLDDGVPKVWHAFTTVECTNLVISYCGSLNLNALPFDEVYGFFSTGCPADAVQTFSGFDPSCGDGNYEVTFGIVPAGTYYMPVGLFGSASTGDYQITITATACPPAPTNDDCANATQLPLNLLTDCPANSLAGSTFTATQDAGDPTCETASGTYQDVWYTFNSGSNASVTLNLDPGTMPSWALVVSLGCGGSEVYCEADPLAPAVIAVDPNTDYIVRVYSNTEFGAGGDFAICATANFPTSIQPLSAAGWQVFPNPTDGGLTLTNVAAGGPVRITLLDMVGRTVYNERSTIGAGASHTLSLRGQVAPGVYTLEVIGSSGRWEKRVVVR
ncbi:MAG: T9SS type A sorting domain-containing protein [Flavobacteriales bacterium]|nr:T9SS type A sorting domain-containing protein [Flavobacteriales bacterium]